MVCSVDHLASSAGLAILRQGGSAVDAAVATSAVLAVTTPYMCGMGGDLFALVHHGTGPPAVLNASGRAGSGADPDRLRAEGHTVMPFAGDVRTVPVPGCVDGWLELHERFGRLPLSEVLAPATRYALEGFPVSGLLAAMVPLVFGKPGAEDFQVRDPGAGTADGARRIHAGERCRRPGVGRALQAIATGGRQAFYQGEFGEGLLALGRGEYLAEDLARRQADWVEPLGRRIWGADVWTTPPNSQGYLTLAAGLMAEGLDLPDDPGDPRWAHLLVECARQAGFDRPAVLHEQARPEQLLDPHALDARRRRIRPDSTSRLGAPAADGGTIHLAVVDADRMGVSLIQSNASGFGALLFEPSTGINLHNRGLGFSLVSGHPAEYGPGRRPPHTLSPALVTAPDGTLRAVVGSMGGDAQPQIVLQLLARLLQAGQEPAEVIQSPRFVLAPADPKWGFDTWSRPDELCVEVEADCPVGWVEGLEARGHQVRVVSPGNHGMGHAHLIEQVGGVLAGASDRRAVHGAVADY